MQDSEATYSHVVNSGGKWSNTVRTSTPWSSSVWSLDSCVRGTKAYAQTFKHQFSKGRHFRIMTNILDQVSFKAESTKTKIQIT